MHPSRKLSQTRAATQSGTALSMLKTHSNIRPVICFTLEIILPSSAAGLVAASVVGIWVCYPLPISVSISVTLMLSESPVVNLHDDYLTVAYSHYHRCQVHCISKNSWSYPIELRKPRLIGGDYNL